MNHACTLGRIENTLLGRDLSGHLLYKPVVRRCVGSLAG